MLLVLPASSACASRHKNLSTHFSSLYFIVNDDQIDGSLHSCNKLLPSPLQPLFQGKYTSEVFPMNISVFTHVDSEIQLRLVDRFERETEKNSEMVYYYRQQLCCSTIFPS